MNDSYIEMSAEQVTKLANDLITKVKTYREQKLQREIQRKIARSERSIIRRILKRPVISEEDARECITNDYAMHWVIGTYEYGQIEDIACKLRKCAKYATVINVSAADLDALARNVKTSITTYRS